MSKLLERVSEVGATIRRVRKCRCLTLPQLATKAKVSKGALSKIENGGNFTVITLYRLATALEVEPSGLTR